MTTQTHTTGSDVNPAGFDMRNAMTAEDVTVSLSVTIDGLQNYQRTPTWGEMIVADRKAFMARDSRIVPEGYVAGAVAARIRRHLRLQNDQLIGAVY